MQGWWWFSARHTLLSSTGVNGHVVVDVCQTQSTIHCSLLLQRRWYKTLSSNDLTPQEKQQWVQSGLALSPLVATCTQYSVDFCLAWALIGEWTSRILFPVPKGPWPRHGHAGALLRRYQARSPRMVAWARATFEQGALPSLLFLQGLVPIFTLPGEKMFQATGLCSHKQRPPIMHAYGGAKNGMAQALQSIASEGWIPLAAAMVGTSALGRSRITPRGGAPRWTSSWGLVPWNTEMWLCFSHAGNGGTLRPLLTVPSIPGSRGQIQRLGPTVKTRHATESGI